MNDNTGHGHVWARPDGVKMRCGGPTMCANCANDFARYHREFGLSVSGDIIDNSEHEYIGSRPDDVEKSTRYDRPTESELHVKLIELNNSLTHRTGWVQSGHIFQMQNGNYVALLRGAYWCALKIDATDDEFVRKIWIKEKTHNIARLSAELWLEENAVVV